MQKLLLATAALSALGWVGASQSYAFTERPVFEPERQAAPLANPDDRLPLFDHRYDPPGSGRNERRGSSFDLPGGGTFQFYGPSSNDRPDDSRYFGRMPGSLPPYAR